MAKMKAHLPATDKGTDAIAALIADHRKVKDLFEQFEKAKDQENADDEKAGLVKQICTELTIHTTIEEEIFYPAAREQIEDEDLMDEALVEHAGAKDLIAQLEEMDPEDDLYDAKVTVLGEQIDHHVKEEEGNMFPKAKKANVDTEALGGKMARRKAELKAELSDSDDEHEQATPSERGSKQPGNQKGLRST
jgi:hemerythrin superfamily protein